MKTQSIRFEEIGAPEDVLSLQEGDVPSLTDGDILVKIHASPINPADINYVQGNYGVRPELPATPGVEGCGTVLESRSSEYAEGDKVIFIERVDAWQSHVVCAGDCAVKIPAELDEVQAAMLKVNPLTALRLIEGFEDLTEGDFLIQNAANSGVGQCVIQIAKILGIKTINLVRREEVMQELLDLGADHVLLDDADVVAKVREICGENLPKLASNAVGGDSALRLMDAVAECGQHVTYGAMSMRSLKVPNKFLIFKRIVIQGLWVTKWLEAASRDEIKAAYDRLAEWVAAGKLTQNVDTIYSPEEIKEAILHAKQSKRDGKVLLRF